MSQVLQCITEKGCAPFTASATVGEENQEQPDLWSVCMAEAATTTPLRQANLDFKSHYCDYAITCVPEITTESECEILFLSDNIMLISKYVESGFIEDADECVYPKPECDNEKVQTCLEVVVNEIQDAIALN